LLPVLAAVVDRPFQAVHAALAAVPCDPCAYAVASGPLDGALRRYSQISGVAIVADPDTVAGRSSRGATGTMHAGEALDRILTGTGLRAVFLDARTARLESTVIAAVGSRASGSDYHRARSSLAKFGALVDVPQTIGIVSQKTMKDEGVASVRDALRNVSGISLAAGEGGAQGDALTIRGFDAKNDFYVDGMRDYGNYYRDAFDLEQVEVSQGASGTIFGRGSTGGTIDQITKQPHRGDAKQVSLIGGTAGMLRATGDFNWQLSDTTAFRLDVMQQHAAVAGRDDVATNRSGIAPAIAFGLGTGSTLFVDYLHLRERDVPDYGLPLLWGKPAPVDRSNFYGFAGADRYDDATDIATVAFVKALTPSIDLHVRTRYASYAHAVSAANGVFAAAPPAGTPLDAIVVDRAVHARTGHETFVENQTDVAAHLRDGSTIRAGLEIGGETSYERTLKYTGLPSTGLLDPDPYQAMTYASATPSETDASAADLGAYVLYSSDAERHWKLDAGARYDRFDANVVDPIGKTSRYQPLSTISGRAAITWKPAASGSIYLSWGSSFNPSIETLTVKGAPTPPEGNDGYELGAKYELGHGALAVTGAVFRQTKTNARQTDLGGVVENIGRVRVDGATVTLAGDLGRAWQTTAGITILNTLVVRSANPGETGNRLANAPHASFTFFNTFRVAPRVRLGFGGTYLSKRFTTDIANAAYGFVAYVPGYARFDAMAKAELSEHLALQLNAYNVTNAAYVDMVYSDHLVPGAARSLTLTLDVR